MTTLVFRDALVENAFSFGNSFYYSSLEATGLYFTKGADNYPYILKGGISDETELHYCSYRNQLRGRLLNTKKIKEVIDSAKIPIIISLRERTYLMGKGFLAAHPIGEDLKLLFVACIDDRRAVSSVDQVKFFVCKDIYTDEYKVLQPAIKDLIGSHPGDVTVCNRITDYIGEKLSMPRGGVIADRKNYMDAVVRTALGVSLHLMGRGVTTTTDAELPF